jgi:hypothetical protein
MPKKEKKMNIPSTKTEATEVTDEVKVEQTEAEANQASDAVQQAETTEVETQETKTPETESKVAEEVKPHVSVEGAFSTADRIPANWNITPTEDGIEAFNSTTGSRFEGSITDFNAKLKG